MNANWPHGTDFSSSNWTGRTQRTDNWGGNYAPNSHRIPPVAWVGAAAFVIVVFIVVPVVGHFAGF